MGKVIQLKNARGWKYYDTRLGELRKQDIETIIERGRVLIAAKEELDHGSYEATVKKHFPLSYARKHVVIANDPILANRSHGSVLPPSVQTLNLLAGVDKKCGSGTLKQWIKEGKINPKMERKDVEALLKVAEDEPTSVISQVHKLLKTMPTLHVNQARQLLPDADRQTVNSALTKWAERGVARDTGKRDNSNPGRGHAAIIYAYDPNPKPRLDVRRPPKFSLRDAEAAIAAQSDDAREKIIARLAGKHRIEPPKIGPPKIKMLKWTVVGEGKQLSYRASTDHGQYHITTAYSISGNISGPLQQADNFHIDFYDKNHDPNSLKESGSHRRIGIAYLLENAKGLAQFDHERNTNSNG